MIDEKKSIVIRVRVTESLRKALESLAKQDSRTLSGYVVKLLSEHVRETNKKDE